MAYQEFGDAKGKPVFWFHGWPSSRLSGQKLDQPAKKVGLRIIAVDRPGFGRSTFKPNRKLLDWPNDVAELADRLKLKKFSVAGGSGGAPYALACAYKIAYRLFSVAVIAGPMPPKNIDHSGLNFSQQFVLKAWSFLGKYSLPTVWLYCLLVTHFSGAYLNFFTRGRAKSDRLAMKDQKLRKQVLKDSREAFCQGDRAIFQDQRIYSGDWGFRLEEIKTKVFLWHGMLDKNARFWMAKYVASHLKNCQATYFPNDGHYLMLNHAEEILSKL